MTNIDIATLNLEDIDKENQVSAQRTVLANNFNAIRELIEQLGITTGAKLEAVNTQRQETAQRTVIQPNLTRIRTDIRLLAEALNALDLGVTQTEMTTYVNQQVMNVTNINGTGVTIDRANFDCSLEDFTGTTVQQLTDYIDDYLAVQVPTITNFSVNFGTAQAANWNVFTSLTDTQRTFNADIGPCRPLHTVVLQANGVPLATYTDLPRETRNRVIPDVAAARTNWTAIVQGAPEENGRKVISLQLVGTQAAPLPAVRSNVVRLLLGAATASETIYWESNRTSATTSATAAVNTLTAITAFGNPSAVTITIPDTGEGKTGSSWFSILVPREFDTVNIIQNIGPLGTVDAHNYFPSFANPSTRTINSVVYNIYASVELVGRFTGTFVVSFHNTT